jgi:hypothetical protein
VIVWLHSCRALIFTMPTSSSRCCQPSHPPRRQGQLVAPTALLALLLLLLLLPAGTHAGIPRTAAEYNPLTTDWASVVAACRHVCSVEKRLVGFFIRAAFHDSLDVTKGCKNCGAGGSGARERQLPT